MKYTIYLTPLDIEVFCDELTRRERTPGTIAQYRHALLELWRFLPGNKKLDHEQLLAWKEETAQQKAVRTVNAMIAAVNAFLEFSGVAYLKLKSMRYQQKTFSEEELTQEEFRRLVQQAEKNGDTQTTMLLWAMAATGIRVSEVRFLTVEAIKHRMAIVQLKGKVRQVPLGDKLCRMLAEFAKNNKIKSGPLFVGKHGEPLDRRRIWERMKALCKQAKVDPEKVHPHALRHLFARVFYELTQDIAKLADLLGHSSINTTRIYIMTSAREHREILDRLCHRIYTKKPPTKGGSRKKRT